MKIKVLASGSSANSTYVEICGFKFLIDIGISYKQAKEKLKEIGVNIKDVNLIITHFHSDHIKGLSTFLKNNHQSIYIKKYGLKYFDFSKYQEQVKIISEKLIFNELTISFFNLSHDYQNIGLLFEYDNKSFVYLTDTGYVNQKLIPYLKNKNIYLVESNYDEKMLIEGDYNYYLKQRIICDSGHLSNDQAVQFLKQVIGNNTKYIILGHISENNNCYNIVEENFIHNIPEFNNNLVIAKQKKGAELIIYD